MARERRAVSLRQLNFSATANDDNNGRIKSRTDRSSAGPADKWDSSWATIRVGRGAADGRRSEDRTQPDWSPQLSTIYAVGKQRNHGKPSSNKHLLHCLQADTTQRSRRRIIIRQNSRNGASAHQCGKTKKNCWHATVERMQWTDWTYPTFHCRLPQQVGYSNFAVRQGVLQLMWPRYRDFSIFQDGGCRHLGFSKFEIFNVRNVPDSRTASPCQIYG